MVKKSGIVSSKNCSISRSFSKYGDKLYPWLSREGIEKRKEIKFNRPKSELTEHQGTIEAYFESNPPATINEAVKRIEELTGIKRSPTQVRKFLKSIGMRCLKVGTIPSKADVEAQDSYREKELEPRLEEAKAGKRAVFFVDMPLIL